jgi:hypothetical protein
MSLPFLSSLVSLGWDKLERSFDPSTLPEEAILK